MTCKVEIRPECGFTYHLCQPPAIEAVKDVKPASGPRTRRQRIHNAFMKTSGG